MKALDHDMNPLAQLVLFGILEIEAAQLFQMFGTSRETSDFVVDCLEAWWEQRKSIYPHIRKLMIGLGRQHDVEGHLSDRSIGDQDL